MKVKCMILIQKEEIHLVIFLIKIIDIKIVILYNNNKIYQYWIRLLRYFQILTLATPIIEHNNIINKTYISLLICES